jgi:glutaryl-CoA dehydrogenase
VITTPAGVGSLGPDHFLVWDGLAPDEVDYRLRTRRFVDEHVLPTIGDYWERAEWPRPLIDRMATLGIVGDGIEGHGCPVMSPLAQGLVQMELCRGDLSLGTFLGVQAGLSMRAIALLGSGEQKERWLPAMARLEAIGAFALTEPDHGSDSVSLETTARRDGQRYVIDGAKRWIGNGSIADVIVVLARGEDGHVNGFLVEKGTAGVTARTITGKGSLRAVWQADIELDGVRVPLENRLPGGGTFKDVSRVLTGSRATCAWSALGQAVAAYETAVAHALSRRQFGRRLASFQLVQDRLAKMLGGLTSMQLYCLRLGQLAAEGRMTGPMASLAKLHNTRTARLIIDEARDLLGGNGILLERHVMRHHADVESLHTYEGTETMQSLIVGREITGLGAFA